MFSVISARIRAIFWVAVSVSACQAAKPPSDALIAFIRSSRSRTPLRIAVENAGPALVPKYSAAIATASASEVVVLDAVNKVVESLAEIGNSLLGQLRDRCREAGHDRSGRYARLTHIAQERNHFVHAESGSR